jgi:hypothetical protein
MLRQCCLRRVVDNAVSSIAVLTLKLYTINFKRLFKNSFCLQLHFVKCSMSGLFKIKTVDMLMVFCVFYQFFCILNCC